jgi:hypothetical protein
MIAEIYKLIKTFRLPFSCIIRHRIKKSAKIKSPGDLKYIRPPFIIEKTAYSESVFSARVVRTVKCCGKTGYRKIYIKNCCLMRITKK